MNELNNTYTVLEQLESHYFIKGGEGREKAKWVNTALDHLISAQSEYEYARAYKTGEVEALGRLLGTLQGVTHYIFTL